MTEIDKFISAADEGEDGEIPSQSLQFVLGELLPTILENLSTAELLKLRLVSKGWDEEIRRILRKRFLVLPFIFCPHEEPATFVRVQASYWNVEHYPCGCPKPEAAQHENQPENENPPVKERQTLAAFMDLIRAHCAKSESQESSEFEQKPKRLFFVHQFFFDSPFLDAQIDLPEIFEFFALYGSHIRYFRMTNGSNFYVGQNGWDARCILKLVPNLETLDLEVASPSQDQLSLPEQYNARRVTRSPESSRVPDFRNLRYLDVYSYQGRMVPGLRELPNLITMAKNLCQVYFSGDLPLEMVSIFAEQGNNVDLLKARSIQLDILQLLKSPTADLDRLEILCKRFKPIGLKCLELSTKFDEDALGGLNDPENPRAPALWRRMFNILCKLLEIHSQTLKTVRLENGAVFLWKWSESLKFLPKLPNVSELTFKCSDPPLNDHLLIRYNDVEEFGNARQRDIDYLPIKRHLLEYSPTINAPKSELDSENYSLSKMFPGLKTLELEWRGAALEWFPFWPQVFHTVEEVKFCIMPKYLHSILSKISAMFPKLRCLTIELYADYSGVKIDWIAHWAAIQKISDLKLEKLSLIIDSFFLECSKYEHLYEEEKLFQLLAPVLGLGSSESWARIFHEWEKSGRWDLTSFSSNTILENPSIFSISSLRSLSLIFHVDVKEQLVVFTGGFVGQLCQDRKIEDFRISLSIATYSRISEWKKAGIRARLSKTLSPFPNVHVEIK